MPGQSSREATHFSASFGLFVRSLAQGAEALAAWLDVYRGEYGGNISDADYVPRPDAIKAIVMISGGVVLQDILFDASAPETNVCIDRRSGEQRREVPSSSYRRDARASARRVERRGLDVARGCVTHRIHPRRSDAVSVQNDLGEGEGPRHG